MKKRKKKNFWLVNGERRTFVKMTMDDIDRLSIGATISGTDIFNESFEGEIVAFDNDFKLVVIRSSKVEKSMICDVKFINLEHTQKVEVIRQASGPPKPLPNLNFDKLADRAKKNGEEKMQTVRYIGNGVTDTAQNLMNYISRVFSESEWKDQDIIIMGQVVVTPPYRRESCRLIDPNSRILEIVQQLIEKFYRENKKS